MKSLKGIGAGLLVAAMASMISATHASAQTEPVACFVAPAKMADADIASFLSNPAAILSENPTGGLPLSTKVRSLAGSSTGTIDVVLGLVDEANDDQKAAIGAGLARAARACASANPEYAALIQEKVAGINSPALITAFLAASNEVQTAALGAGGAGGGAGGAAGIGGGGTAGPGSAGLSGDDTFAQSGGSGGSSGGGSSYSAGNNYFYSVSPTDL